MTTQMNTPLVLVVEDDPDIAALLEDYLRANSYRAEKAGDGEQAMTLFRAAQPDLMLLDIQMPGMDGLEVLKRVRLESNVPVIMITARAEDSDKIVGLELGADDYVTKPFEPRVVMARVKAALRRAQVSSEQDDKPIRVGEIELDPAQASVTVSGSQLQLTVTEYRVLLQMAEHPGRTYSRGELLEAVLPESEALERVMDTHLRNLRKKLEPYGADAQLQTMRGLGYRLVA